MQTKNVLIVYAETAGFGKTMERQFIFNRVFNELSDDYTSTAVATEDVQRMPTYNFSNGSSLMMIPLSMSKELMPTFTHVYIDSDIVRQGSEFVKKVTSNLLSKQYSDKYEMESRVKSFHMENSNVTIDEISF